MRQRFLYPHRRSPALSLVALLALASSAVAGSTPDLAYDTTITGYHLASGGDIVVDQAGCAFVFGRAINPDGNDNDVVLAKLDADGTPLWHFAISGEAHDIYGGAALDSNGDLWITGWTDSADFPLTPDAMDSDLTGFREAFITKIAGDDGSILYSTFLGGDYADGGNDIVVGPDGNLYLTGYTRSVDFPVVNAFQDEIAGYPYGATDAFITVLSPDGQTILYSTYLGGFAVDKATSIAVDLDGAIFIHGETKSDDWPTVNALQANHAGGEFDTFLARLSADGQTLDFSTYLGGEDEDWPGRLALDGFGNVYVTGVTRSAAFPTTAGSYQPNFAGAIAGCEEPFGGHYNCEDAFVSKISGDGSAMLYSTYLGGSRPDAARAIAVDEAGSARIVGYTTSPDFPGGIDGSADIFIARLNEEGSDLEWVFATFSGSANQGHGAAVGPDGATYFTGAIDVPANVYIGKFNDGATGPAGDIDGDGDVDQADLGALLAAYGSCAGDANWNPDADLNDDDCIGQDDLGILLANYGS